MQKNCILYDNKVCSGCGECDLCDLDPSKVCDNCGKCLDDFDYNGIQIDDLIEEGEADLGEDYSGDNWRFQEQDPVDGGDEETLFIDDIDGLSEEIEHNNHHHHHDDHCDCHKH